MNRPWLRHRPWRWALAVLWLACSAVPAQGLRLAVSRGPVSLPIYVAEAQGFFAQQGVTVHLQECSSGRHCVGLLGQGAADLATAAELLVTLGSRKGSDLALIATLSASTRHIKLVARRGAGIQTAAQLRGKRIATVAGTSAHYFLDRWLVFQDIDPEAVKTVFLPPEQLIGALQGGQVDAVAIWEPIAGQALAALGPDALLLPSPSVYTQHFSLVALRLLIATREAELLQLLRALQQAEQFIAREPGQARQILQKRLGAEAGPDPLGEHDFRLALRQSLVTTMEAQARWAERQGRSGTVPQDDARPVNVLQIIEPSLLRRVVPGAVSLVQ